MNYWIDQIEENKSKDYPVSLVLFGNKCDMEDEIKVNPEDIEKVQQKYNLKYFKTSAKDGTNVQNIFEYLAKLVLKSRGLFENLDIDEISVSEKEEKRIEVKDKIKQKKKRKKKCC